jgi:hypothetical protein
MTRDLNVFGDEFCPGGPPIVQDCGACCSSDSHVWIYDEIPRLRRCEDESLYQLNGKLTGMYGLLDVIRFHVRKYPHIARVLAERISGVLAHTTPLPRTLARIFLRNPYGIDIEMVRVAFREPQDDFVAPGESSRAVKAVFKMPDDAISQGEVGMASERRVEKDVEGKDAAVDDVIAYFPADASAGPQHSYALVDHRCLVGDVLLDGAPARSLILLGEVVGRGCDDELSARGWKLPEEV